MQGSGSRAISSWRGALLAVSLIASVGLCASCRDQQEGPVSQPEMSAQPAEKGPLDRYQDTVCDRCRLTVGNAFLAREIPQLEKAVSPAAKLLQGVAGSDEPALRIALEEMLRQNAALPADQLQKSADRLDRRVEDMKANWRMIGGARVQNQDALSQMRNERIVAHPLMAVLGSAGSRYWGWGLLAALTVLGLSLHSRRQELRRWWLLGRSGRTRLPLGSAVATAILAAAALLTGAVGDRICYRWLDGERSTESWQSDQDMAAQRVEAEVQGLQQKRDQLDQNATRILDRLAESPAAGGGQAGVPAPPLLESWRQSRTSVRKMHEALAILEDMQNEIDADSKQIDRLQEEMQAVNKALNRNSLLAARWQLGLTSSIAAFALGSGCVFALGRRRERKRVANTCPVCLATNGLKPEALVLGPDGTSTGDGPPMVVCDHDFVGGHAGEKCAYRFSAAYRSLPRLCFPTIGVREAGKTRWLAMASHRLGRGEYPPTMALQRVRAERGEYVDRLVADIFDREPLADIFDREPVAEALPYPIPRPLVFSFLNRDPWGWYSVLLNLFDYSGDVTSQSRGDLSRQRAIEADGYLVFLDPTQPADQQSKALTEFAEDVRLLRGLKPGQHVNVPTAVCLSKIDELLDRSAVIGSGVQRFFARLQEIDPSGRSLRRSVLRQRSQLTADLARHVWKNWDAERVLRDFAGKPYAFFPLTTLGLRPPGQSGGADSFIDPFGTIEPLLWLLEMNGHLVLER